MGNCLLGGGECYFGIGILLRLFDAGVCLFRLFDCLVYIGFGFGLGRSSHMFPSHGNLLYSFTPEWAKNVRLIFRPS